MPDDEQSAAFWEKAMENLESARSEFGFGRYNACANRCYFACFQAAIVALARGGIVPRGRDAMWGHAFVQAQFNEHLIRRRKTYPASLKSALLTLLRLRTQADYAVRAVSAQEASRSLRTATDFVHAVEGSSE